MSRLDNLLEMLSDDKEDAFLIYAIATEYKAIGENMLALKYYERLLNDFEDYAGTYYHLAELYESLGETEKAKKTYEKGIFILEKNKATKLLLELKSAYQNFLL